MRFLVSKAGSAVALVFLLVLSGAIVLLFSTMGRARTEDTLVLSSPIYTPTRAPATATITPSARAIATSTPTMPRTAVTPSATVTPPSASVTPPPQGTAKLLFPSKRGSSWQIWSTTPGKGDDRQLTTAINLQGDSEIHSLSLSPDGRHIAFRSSSPSKEGQGWTYVYDIQTHRVWEAPSRSIVPNPYGTYYIESWSPDGRLIVVEDHANYSFVSIDGSKMERLDLPKLDVGSPGATAVRISPDGKMVAYARGRIGGGGSLWVMNMDGSDKRMLAEDPRGLESPSWSPDGRRIAFVKQARDGFHGELWTVSPDGSNLERMVLDSDQISFPAWSPDGGGIAFLRKENQPAPGDAPPPAGWVTNLWKVDLGSRKVQQLTSFSNRSVRDPSWSPDGTSIGVVTSETKDLSYLSDSWVIPAAGGTAIRVSPPEKQRGTVSWLQ